MKLKKRRKHKMCHKPEREVNRNKKSVYDVIGLPSDVISNEPKVVLTGDFLLEFYNHRGIIDLTETMVKINTKKAIYNICGIDLYICEITDEEIRISGKIISIEREI